MAKDRSTKTTDGRHLIAVGLPLGVVLGVLVLGAVLQTGPSPARPAARARMEEPPLPAPPTYERRRLSDSALEEHPLSDEGEPIAEAPEPAPASTGPSREIVSYLAQRVLNDIDRLQSSGHEWTAQIGVYCEDRRVSELSRQFGGESQLYVLPVLLNDRACFRLCWGQYATHDRAKQTAHLPAPFRGEPSLPRRIATVVQ